MRGGPIRVVAVPQRILRCSMHRRSRGDGAQAAVYGEGEAPHRVQVRRRKRGAHPVDDVAASPSGDCGAGNAHVMSLNRTPFQRLRTEIGKDASGESGALVAVDVQGPSDAANNPATQQRQLLADLVAQAIRHNFHGKRPPRAGDLGRAMPVPLEDTKNGLPGTWWRYRPIFHSPHCL